MSARQDDDADDVRLVEAIVAGEAIALARLYERYAGFLFRIAMVIVRDRCEAEDLVHDVFLETWLVARDFDPRRGRVRTWLTIRMRSRTVDRVRSPRLSRNAGDECLEDLAETSSASPDHARVRAAMERLDTGHQRVLRSAYFEDMTRPEIAARVGIPVGTVKSRLATALVRLRESFHRPIIPARNDAS